MDPTLDGDDIQGNVMPGFGRMQQRFVAFQTDDKDHLKQGLKSLSGKVTTLSQAMTVKAQRKAAFIAGVAPPSSDELWLNVALGSAALQTLGLLAVAQRDLAFQVGMIPARTGDSTSDRLADGTLNPASPDNWRVGGPNARIDLLCIFASDNDVSSESSAMVTLLESAGLRVIYSEATERLPNATEHFGFVDGISMPGPLGVVTVDGALQQVTTRYGVPPRNGDEFGKPGQLLADPGQFVFNVDADPSVRNGSFLVLRRLTQDVAGFYADTDRLAGTLSASLNTAITGAELRAHVIGRWPSGQPLMRPVADPTQPEDMQALNHFGFLTPSPAVVLSDGTHVPASATDPEPLKGLLCPIWSHIRKVNPRDLPTNLGGPDDTAGFQMLRRAIPFGPQYDHVNPAAPGNTVERGLMFVAYQTSISTQFEKLNSNWMNTPDGPAEGGYDLMVGQRLSNGLPIGKTAAFAQPTPAASIPFITMAQWVTPTGGAYLFSPGLASLSAIAM